MALVDYGAGRENMGSLYSNLRQAIADKGRAENLQKARQIEREGLFGTGISSSDLKGMSDVGLGIAEFGQGRMEKQMANAEKSFGRRQAADERRLATLQKRADLGDKKALDEMQGIQMGMSERRNAFEDKMGEYSGKGIWGTGFGSEEVGWRTSDKGAVGPESDFSRRMRSTPSTPEEDKDLRLGAMGERSFHDPDAVPDWRRGGSQQTMAPVAQSAPGGRSEYEDKHGMGTSPFTTSNFPGQPSREDFNISPRQSAPGGRSEWEDKHGMGTAPPMGLSGARNPRGARRGRTGGGAEQRIPEAFQMDKFEPRSNKFSEGIMNTGRRSGPVQDNAPFETFKDAFRNARREKGAGGTFDWRGNEYTTDYK